MARCRLMRPMSDPAPSNQSSSSLAKDNKDIQRFESLTAGHQTCQSARYLVAWLLLGDSLLGDLTVSILTPLYCVFSSECSSCFIGKQSIKEILKHLHLPSSREGSTAEWLQHTFHICSGEDQRADTFHDLLLALEADGKETVSGLFLRCAGFVSLKRCVLNCI